MLIGGDDMIPFFRVPDETTIANESDYYNELRSPALGGGTPPLNDKNSLAGSLFYHFIQTDNFYADRKPTPWRGRALYIP